MYTCIREQLGTLSVKLVGLLMITGCLFPLSLYLFIKGQVREDIKIGT
jgi:hypothetical protein